MQLPLPDHVHRLDSGNELHCAPERFKPQHWICDSLHDPVVLLDDVVEILRLAQLDVQTSTIVDAVDCRSVGTAFVDGDFLGQAVQIDGAL